MDLFKIYLSPEFNSNILNISEDSAFEITNNKDKNIDLAIIPDIENSQSDCGIISIKNSDNNSVWIEGILNSTKDAVFGIDNSGKITFINTAAHHLIGIEIATAKGMDADRVIQLNLSNKKSISFLDKLELGVKIDGEVYNQINKSFIHVTGKITPIKDKNKVLGKVVLLTDIREFKSLFTKMSYQSAHDNLTGILNRQSFIEQAERLINMSKYNNETNGLIILSLDKFRVVNDTCGHMAGDELLRKVAYLLNEADENNSIIKGRIGGDEFGLLLKNATVIETKHFTKKIKRAITSQDFIWGDKEFPISCSFGIVTIDKDTKDHYSLFAAADDACGIAKERGGGKIEIYSDIAAEYNKRRGEMLWIHKLKDAINNKQFKLYYQEIKSLKKEDVIKIEILVRIDDGNGNIVSPLDFIPPAEIYGIMPKIDKIVIEQSILTCKKILDNKKIKDKFLFSVNISGTSIPDKSLPGFITSMFQKYKVPPTLFCFEITETSVIKNLSIASDFIKSLKMIGCTFSLDDFGSGFSNFTYLRNLDVDYLKIDGSFIKDIVKDPISRAMVESINSIGHTMKMKTIAEFVENNEVLDELIEIGVDYFQGFVFSKPTPIENILL
ncbi:MAG: EAL domain-containing protein [Spirochaetales bacterium]|nr:EAL domain-containing protein [Spirochaetales bacterium]